MGYDGKPKQPLDTVENVQGEFLSVLTLSRVTAAVFEGHSFEGSATFLLGSGATKYISFEVPLTSPEKYITLQARIFKTDLADVDLEILWDAASITGGADIPIFNNYRTLNEPSVVIYKEDPTIDETGSTIREEDFIQAGPQGAKSTGQIGLAGSTRVYRAGEHFVVKITNNASQTNKIKLGYEWLEAHVADDFQ